MPFMEFGTAEGLAYQKNWDAQMNRELQLHQLRRQAHIDAENKAKMLDFDVPTGLDPYHTAKVTERIQKLLPEMTKFQTANPNWNEDPLLRAQMKAMQRSVIDSEDVWEGLSYKKHKELLDKFAADTPGAMDMKEVQDQYANFKKATDIKGNGTIDGKNKFQFLNPMDSFDADSFFNNHAKSLSTEALVTEEEASTTPGVYLTKSYVPEDEITKAAYNIWENSNDSYKLKSKWAKMSPEAKAYFTNPSTGQPDPVQWIQKSLKVPTKINPSRIAASKAGTTGESNLGGYSAFIRNVAQMQRGQIGFDPNIAQMDGLTYKDASTGKEQYNPSEPLMLAMTDNMGQIKDWTPLSSYQGTPIEAAKTGRFMTDPAGRTMVEFSGYIPLKKELIAGTKPVLKNDQWWFNPTSPDDFESADYEDNPATSKVINIERDAKGKKLGRAKVTFWQPMPTNESVAQNYDKAALGQKAANEAIGTRLQYEQIDAIKNQYEGKILESGGKKYLIQNGKALELK